MTNGRERRQNERAADTRSNRRREQALFNALGKQLEAPMAQDSINLHLREMDRQVLTEAAQQSGTSLAMYIRELIECRAAEIRESKTEVKQ
jgi:hypothetical protein